MFVLKKNNFLDSGKCWYTDECKNKAIMIRKEAGFVAKIRFYDKEITAEPLQVDVPSSNEEGADLRMHYPPGALERNDVKVGIDGFTKLVQHWINMLYDIKFMDCSNELIKRSNPGATKEDIYLHKMNRIAEYDELQPLISSVFSDLPK